MGREQRRAPRIPIRAEGLLANADGSIIERCTVMDVSATGARIVLLKETALPDRFVLLLSRNGQVRRNCTVVRRDGVDLGVAFDVPEKVTAEPAISK